DSVNAYGAREDHVWTTAKRRPHETKGWGHVAGQLVEHPLRRRRRGWHDVDEEQECVGAPEDARKQILVRERAVAAQEPHDALFDERRGVPRLTRVWADQRHIHPRAHESREEIGPDEAAAPGHDHA